MPGAHVTLRGSGLVTDPFPSVQLGDRPARVLFASANGLLIEVPGDIPDGGVLPVRLTGAPGQALSLHVASTWAEGLHQVDSPVFDEAGNLFVTYSGTRGEESAVSIFRATADACTREPFVSGIVNATSMTIGPDGRLYVSSRFEGAVYRIDADGTYEQIATDLGVACGLAFDDDGWLYVGDRTGTIFRVRDGAATPFATLPPSIAAYHLAMSREQELFVSGPTLGSYDHLVRIGRDGTVRALPAAFGRPQGLAFDGDGVLHVVDALAGAAGVYRLANPEAAPELVAAAVDPIGVAFGPAGVMVVVTRDTAYRW